MPMKVIKIHSTASRELATKLAEKLRNNSQLCSDPVLESQNNTNIWQVKQYVTTSYPEL